MTPFSFLLLLTLALPSQNVANSVQKTQSNHARRSIQQNDSAGVGCYSIRSYIFERHDGKAPELVGETTCTPANLAKPERAKKRPEVKLVPMKMNESGPSKDPYFQILDSR